MYALILSGCAAPLLPGESVLGVDRPASFTYGGPEARLGARVAAHGASWLATAPGAAETWRDGVPRDEPAAWVGFEGEREVLVSASGAVTRDGEAIGGLDDAVDVAVGPRGVLAATPEGLRVLDPPLVIPVVGARAVAWGERRVLALVCATECALEAWDLDGEPLGVLAPGGEGGAVTEWDGRAWAGAPDWEDPEGRGRACAEDGACVEGLPGDHLGAAFGRGYTTGTFNKWIVPARTRVVPLGGGEVLALETGAEAQPVVLGGDDLLVIGTPYMAAAGVPAGAVVTVAP